MKEENSTLTSDKGVKIPEVVEPKKPKLSPEKKEAIKKASVIKRAKEFGLFKYNKKYRQWEIIIPVNEYEKI